MQSRNKNVRFLPVEFKRGEVIEGVPMALGATPGQVSAMIVKRGAWLMLTDSALGLMGCLLTMQLLAGYAQKVSTFDPLTFGAVASILLAAGMQACF